MATTEKETGNGVALAATQQTEIDQIRRDGAFAVQRSKELNLIARRMEGLTWGTVNGASLSPQVRHLIAEFCYTIGANELTHIEILGNRPYLTVRFYEDLLNQHDHYIGYEQTNVSVGACKELRAKAKEARDASNDCWADAERMGDADLKTMAGAILREAYEYEARARSFDLKRAHYGAPDDEKSEVYETVIRRYAPLAPIEDIRAGMVDPAPWIQQVAECNWAGAKEKDPVGGAHPGLTARSRSFRRAAQKSFSAYMEPKLKAVEHAERMIEAEFEIIKRDIAARALPANGPQALTSGSGEPAAAKADNAQPLPVDDRTTTEPQSPAGNANGATVQFNEREAQQAYFGGLRDAGIQTGGPDRKAWQLKNGLPESVTEFKAADFARAMELLIGELRQKATEGAKLLGFSTAAELCTAWGVVPESTRDWRDLLTNINAKIDEREAAGGSRQRELLK